MEDENGDRDSCMGSEFDASQSQVNQLSLLKYSFKRITAISKYRKCFMKKLHELEDDVNTMHEFDKYLDGVLRWTQNYIDSGTDIEKKLAKQIKNELVKDANGIRACVECFAKWKKDRTDYFKEACSPPHLIVFAKFANYRCWPAKVMTVLDHGVNVEFFGDHSQADVAESDCQLFSEKASKKGKSKSFNEAIDELEAHIECIKNRFGSFYPAKFRTQLSVHNIKQQLRDMIPGAFLDAELPSPISIDPSEPNCPTESSSLDVPLLDELNAEQHIESGGLRGRKRHATNDDIDDVIPNKVTIFDDESSEECPIELRRRLTEANRVIDSLTHENEEIKNEIEALKKQLL
ncbi:uncharacterized protein LOC116337315 [Contarinia nasturtii]|uniref:uncharacterized protein LOC116337315 n=1 Tax=Contarinia nasturtii TaxID=265458 RepID=UPI0012D45E47|nr:uncharacterized protein LOC116337315 [Contarinia nasturtii]